MATKQHALDVNDDFDKPVRQEKHIETAVQKGFALAKFVKVIFDRDEDDKAFAVYEMSLPLTEEHSKWCPAEIAQAWAIVVAHGYKIANIPVETQVADLQLAPEAKDGALKIDVAEIESASIAKIVEKGAGEEKEVIRLSFRMRMDLDNDTARFARVHFSHPVWLKLQPLQRKLIR